MTENIKVISRDNEIIKIPKRAGALKFIPGIVWSCRPFKFLPKTFCLDHPQLSKTKFFDKNIQIESLEHWKQNTTVPRIYVCTSSPDDLTAKYFASYLIVQHLQQLKNKANVVWEELNSSYSDYDTDVCKPTLLVLSGLCVDSSKVRLEKARDLVNKYYDIPRIVIGGGTDPITFASVYLRTPVNSIFYSISSLCASSSQVI